MKSWLKIFLIVNTSIAHAQVSVEFTTNLYDNLTWGFVESVSDSILVCGYYVGIWGSSGEHIITHTIRKDDLSIKDTNTIWSRNGRAITSGGLNFQYVNGNGYYLDYWMNDSNQITAKVSLSYLNSDKTPGAHLFSKRWPGFRMMGVPQIIGDSMYIQLTTAQFSDTTIIEVIDLQGSLKLRKHFDYNTIYGPFTTGPFHTVAKDSILVISSALDGSLLLLDRYSLDTIKSIKVDLVKLANHEYGGFTTRNTRALQDRIIISGSVDMLFGIQSGNINIDEQAFYYTRTWSGDSMYLANYGPKQIDNDAFVEWFDNYAGTHFLASRMPAVVNPISSYPNQIVIYRFNQFGYDSIALFGNQNHFPRFMYGDSNGDLYLFSTYTLTGSTGETKGVLTKIPAFAIGLIENKLISPQIILYPNPTTDWVRLDVGEKKIESLKVYNQQGQLLLRGEKPANNEINITALPASIYVVVAELAKGERISALVKKE